MSEFDPYRKILGIQHSNRPVDHYELLGIDRFELDKSVIEAAITRRVALLQDIATGSQYVEASQKLLNEIARARLCLMDAEQRAEYDQRLAATNASPTKALPSNSSARDKTTKLSRPKQKQSSPLGSLVVYLVALVLVGGVAIGLVYFVIKKQNHGGTPASEPLASRQEATSQQESFTQPEAAPLQDSASQQDALDASPLATSPDPIQEPLGFTDAGPLGTIVYYADFVSEKDVEFTTDGIQPFLDRAWTTVSCAHDAKFGFGSSKSILWGEPSAKKWYLEYALSTPVVAGDRITIDGIVARGTGYGYGARIFLWDGNDEDSRRELAGGTQRPNGPKENGFISLDQVSYVITLQDENDGRTQVIFRYNHDEGWGETISVAFGVSGASSSLNADGLPAASNTPDKLISQLGGDATKMPPTAESKTPTTVAAVSTATEPEISPSKLNSNDSPLWHTSFENVKSGEFKELSIDGIEIKAEGIASINSEFARTGKQCLWLQGGMNNSVTIDVPEKQQQLGGITFHAERYTEKGPFEFSVEVKQNDKWKKIAKLDNLIVVGARFLSHIKLPIPGGQTTSLRITTSAPAGSGVLIDDLSLTNTVPESLTPLPARKTFEDFASNFELPAIGDNSPKRIDFLAIDQRFLLGASLLCPEGVSPQMIVFEMRRSDTDKQRWIVAKQNAGDPATIDIASFWRTDDALMFQWLPSAERDENVNYLCNCALKLETPDGQSSWLDLRKPILIEGFQIASDQSSVTVNQELLWLPSSKSVVVELQPFPAKEIPSHCSPEYVTRKPAVMHFSRDVTMEFIWLEVSAKIRSEFRLEAELMIKTQGRTKPMKTGSLEQFQKDLFEIISAAESQLALTKNEEAKNQISAIVDAAIATRNILGEYHQAIPKIYGTDIPVAIYVSVGDHKILIAKSNGVVEFK